MLICNRDTGALLCLSMSLSLSLCVCVCVCVRACVVYPHTVEVHSLLCVGVCLCVRVVCTHMHVHICLAGAR